MVSSGLLRRVALVRTTRRNNPEDTILHFSFKFSEGRSVFIYIAMRATCPARPSSLQMLKTADYASPRHIRPSTRKLPMGKLTKSAQIQGQHFMRHHRLRARVHITDACTLHLRIRWGRRACPSTCTRKSRFVKLRMYILKCTLEAGSIER
jgi:hypothetical protein